MSSNPVIVVGVFLLVLFIVALTFGILVQRRRVGTRAAPPPSSDWVESLSQPIATSGERLASSISEEIEELVHARLRTDSALKDIKVDFGSAPDGTLEIWLNDERYLAIDAIPDVRIRSIIQEAVAAYNEGLA
jgi:hypothetical protein